MFRKLSNLHEPWASANLKTLETSLVPINHEKHEQVDTMFYLSYTQQLIHHTSLHSLRLCSQVLFKAIKNIMLPHVKSGVKFLKVSQKNICLHSWAEKWRHFVQMFVLVFFKFWFFFLFHSPMFPRHSTSLCWFQGIFIFAISLSCSTMFWFGGKSAIQIWSMIYIIVLITCMEGRS